MQQFAVIVKPNPQDGGFIATVPGPPHIVGQGETEEAALEDARIALESTPAAGDAETTNGAEDPEGTPHPFDSRPALEALASEQGVEPTGDFDALLGDFWPDDEGVDEFVTAWRGWRHHTALKRRTLRTAHRSSETYVRPRPTSLRFSGRLWSIAQCRRTRYNPSD